MKNVILIHPKSKAEVPTTREQADKMLARGHGWTEKTETKGKSKSKSNAVTDRSADAGTVEKSAEPEGDNDCGCP